jgi:hypothetical protein
VELGFPELKLIGSGEDDNHDIVARPHFRLEEPPAFPEDPPGPVSLHGPGIGTNGNEYDSIVGQAVRNAMDPHSLAGIPLALVEGPIDLGPLANLFPFSETQSGDGAASALFQSLVLLLLVGSGKLDSSLGSPALENEATTAGLHAGAKAELAVAANFAGLVGAFHDPGSLGLSLTASRHASSPTVSKAMPV